MRHAAAQRFRRHVHQLHLLGAAHHGVGDGLALPHPGDRLDHVAEGLQVLDVHRGDHGDLGVEQLRDVLPALLVARTRGVRVRQLVDQRHRGVRRDHRVHVHLLEYRAAVLDAPAGDHLQSLDLRLRLRAAVRLHVPDHDRRAAGGRRAPR
ncbi:hypothetical protein MTP03_09370 [Tsukamurella sp. PLM1]|nr:hypothetical protein MTP03_09370 [Tsukamurella sp. PLM1]